VLHTDAGPKNCVVAQQRTAYLCSDVSVPAHRTAFIPFITAGDPDMDTTAQALRRLDQNGATVIELGVAYSVRGCPRPYASASCLHL